MPAPATAHRGGAAQHPIFRVVGIRQYRLARIVARNISYWAGIEADLQVNAFADIARIFTCNSQDFSMQ